MHVEHLKQIVCFKGFLVDSFSFASFSVSYVCA
uniref:Uncharacterized protein n=1 Tax=Arundo donax TaxID=35708 RepID=A0A0A9BYS0_ARUDO